jgi:hypothetical protein
VDPNVAGSSPVDRPSSFDDYLPSGEASAEATQFKIIGFPTAFSKRKFKFME